MGNGTELPSEVTDISEGGTSHYMQNSECTKYHWLVHLQMLYEFHLSKLKDIGMELMIVCFLLLPTLTYFPQSYLFSFTSECFARMHVSLPHAWSAYEARKGIRFSRREVTHSCMVLGIEPRSCEEQPVLLTLEPSQAFLVSKTFQKTWEHFWHNTLLCSLKHVILLPQPHKCCY